MGTCCSKQKQKTKTKYEIKKNPPIKKYVGAMPPVNVAEKQPIKKEVNENQHIGKQIQKPINQGMDKQLIQLRRISVTKPKIDLVEQQKAIKVQEKSKIKQLKEKKQYVLENQVKLYSQYVPPKDDITSQVLENKGSNDTDKRKFQAMQLFLLAAKKQNVNIQYSNQISQSQIGLTSMLTSGIQDSVKLSIHFDEGDNGRFGYLNYDQIKQNPQNEEQFERKLTNNLAEIYGVQQENVHLISCVRGSVQVEVIINSINKNQQAFQGRNVLQKIETYSQRSVMISIIQPNYVLCSEDFDPKGDFQFPTTQINYYIFKFQRPIQGQLRGGLVYHQPSAEWVRYGLNVLYKFDGGDNKWLKMKGEAGEWGVAFHGFTRPDFVAKTVQRGPQKQQHQEYASEGRGGVYCTPLIDLAAQQSSIIQLDGCDYIVVMQCRVKPSSIQECSDPNYWVVNDPKDVRPYGICFKKVGQSNSEVKLSISQLVKVPIPIHIPMADNMQKDEPKQQEHRYDPSLQEAQRNRDQKKKKEYSPQQSQQVNNFQKSQELLIDCGLESKLTPKGQQYGNSLEVNSRQKSRAFLKISQKSQDQSNKNNQLQQVYKIKGVKQRQEEQQVYSRKRNPQARQLIQMGDEQKKTKKRNEWQSLQNKNYNDICHHIYR